MCGGDSVSYTYNRTNLGLDLVKVDTLADGRYTGSRIQDNLRRYVCCWSNRLYTRPLTEADVNLNQLDLTSCTEPLSAQARDLIETRRGYMARVAEQEARAAENSGNKCAIL